ncbi:hypothetical protein OUZ56_015255 [Daphnia magna]|uniref:Uncharacterized protein n=1 Tax=Daphnia magna TaxID=35525 RepID=A0ABR0AMA3_9CRUS|nr:hypothetical protein OUZ56_015255 [Daphnia magna]
MSGSEKFDEFKIWGLIFVFWNINKAAFFHQEKSFAMNLRMKTLIKWNAQPFEIGSSLDWPNKLSSNYFVLNYHPEIRKSYSNIERKSGSYRLEMCHCIEEEQRVVDELFSNNDDSARQSLDR